jgi:hypothetical protein
MRNFRPFVLWIALGTVSLAATDEAWADRPTAAPRGASALPNRPTARPAPPAASPGRPAATPSRPSAAPMRPAATPSRPSAAPMRPAATPSRPSAAPDRPAATPSRPSAAPGRPTGSAERSGRPGTDRTVAAGSRGPSHAPRAHANVPHRVADRARTPRADGRVPASPSSRRDFVPLQRRPGDHRYARPDARAVHARHLHHPRAHYAPPRRSTYVPYYTRWWVHPYWRYQYATTSVVVFDFYCDPWYDTWTPPYRTGWVWVPGDWAFGYWNPGYWAPQHHSPYAGYVYVPGFWSGAAYIEGYYRPLHRPTNRADDGWEWIDGYYLDDGSYIWGYWAPTEPAPDGYLWEAGFYDGETYIDGFWRPEYREGYTWVAGYYDDDGVFYAGYWAPTDERPGQVWVPGWFDGNVWQEGYWVDEADFESSDPESYEPEAGWDAGWEVGSGWGAGAVIENQTRDEDAVDADELPVRERADIEELPLAIPVEP